MPEPLQLIIGGKEHERVEVALIGRECPESFDLYDGNWLEARVSVAVGAFRGEFSCTLRAQDFAELLPQLRRLHADLLGSARFSTMEGQLEFEIIGDGRGHLKVRGRVVDQPGDGTSLEWSLAIDQTFLPAMIEAVSAISTMYEVRGGGPSSSPQEPGIVAAALATQRQQPPERPGHFLRSVKTIAAITVCLSSAWLLYGIAVELFIAWYSGAEADLGWMAWTTITAQVVVNLAAIVLALRVVRAAPPHHAAR